MAVPMITTSTLPTASGANNSKPVARLFRSFNTQVPSGSRDYILYDLDAVKQDLMNAFNLRVGEAVMRPTAGCIIWDKLFEPFTAGLIQEIVDNCKAIIAAESRVVLIDFQVFNQTQGITVSIVLRYKYFNKIEPLIQFFDRSIVGEAGK